MIPRFLLIVAAISVFSIICTNGTGHSHHHVIIHIPYKVHTIHHTILKHIHHHDKGGEDKYEVLGYTVGKPMDLSHHLGSGDGGGHGHEEMQHHHQQHQHEEHDLGGGNELGHGHDWAPSYVQHDFTGGGAHLGEHADVDAAGAGHRYAYYKHGSYRGYD
ncbi:hypothetical protein TSAR_010997 [Trichomalopsis sarcophagae]|uniref:Uncharacterized protein n=1 Tax=Trichomalopsis sarcophagae TaxID=543379 RepID=A0A232EJ71_9HYME|nr:hypothetical protein TSAR_010997 [Trichomalopsis sarcophagae]